jgi:acyl-CoA reductase-like NAD-dependent aldehyde dehydrogenase
LYWDLSIYQTFILTFQSFCFKFVKKESALKRVCHHQKNYYQQHTMPLVIDSPSSLPVVPLWINGEAATSSPPITFTVHSAAQHKDVYLAQATDTETARRAVDAAWTAFQDWKKTNHYYRRELLLRVAAIYRRRKEELVKIQIEETSCQEPWARMNVDLAAGMLDEVASRISGITGEIPQMGNPNSMALVFNEPVGPVLAIAP